MSKLPQIPIALVIDTLNAMETRATYGAVAAVIGGVQPLCVGAVLQQVGGRCHRNSWVVKSDYPDKWLPTGYAPDQRHPQLERYEHVIESEDELRARISEFVVGGATADA